MWSELSMTIAPDLAAEVVSPNDLASELDRKLREYRRAGVPLVWVIDPEVRGARIYRGDGTSTELDEDGLLTGEAVLPGFSCRVGDLLLPPTAGPIPAG